MSEDERGAKALREGRTLTDMHMLVVRAYHAQTNYLRAQVAHAGLGPGQPKVLSYLAVHGPSSQSDIARFFEIDCAAVSRMFDSLLKGGFVRIFKGSDARMRQAELTQKGHEALAVWEAACDEADDIMLSGLTEEERQTLNEGRAFQGPSHRQLAALGMRGGGTPSPPPRLSRPRRASMARETSRMKMMPGVAVLSRRRSFSLSPLYS